MKNKNEKDNKYEIVINEICGFPLYSLINGYMNSEYVFGNFFETAFDFLENFSGFIDFGQGKHIPNCAAIIFFVFVSTTISSISREILAKENKGLIWLSAQFIQSGKQRFFNLKRRNRFDS